MLYKSYAELVNEFHNAFQVENSRVPTWLPYDVEALRMRLIAEEFEELDEALLDRDMVGVADALADLVYVVIGMADVMGIDFDSVFREVHRSNMSKLGDDGLPVRREDGKVLKGPGFVEPNLSRIIGDVIYDASVSNV